MSEEAEQAARAYPVEVEQALQAWIAENERQGIWVSPAGWWYAGWKYGRADVEALKKRLPTPECRLDEWFSGGCPCDCHPAAKAALDAQEPRT